MESIKLDNLLINFTTEFHRIWDTSGSKSKPAAFWRPTPAPDVLPGFFPLGDVAVSRIRRQHQRNKEWWRLSARAISPSEDASKGKALSRPDDFEQVWKDSGSGAKSGLLDMAPDPS